MPETIDAYRALQIHLDSGPVGFPAAPSGIEIELIKKLFTEEEARIAACMSTIKLEPPKTIRRRVKKAGLSLTVEEVSKKLEEMARKGLIMAYSKGRKEKHYKNAGMTAGGIIDFQVNRMTKELTEIFDRYHKEIFAGVEMTGKRSVAQLRTIPVEKAIPAPDKHAVATYDDVRRLIEDSPGPFAVANCMCRQSKDIRGEPCKHSDIRETCLQIGADHARQYVEMGCARYIDKEEAYKILDRAREAGFILQPENSLKPEAICCCCGDCCGLLSAVVKSPRPAELYATNYYAVVDTAKCLACGKCVQRCQLNARTLSNLSSPSTGEVRSAGASGEGEKPGLTGRTVSVVNLDRCIGCGNCVVTCESGASKLEKKLQPHVPPKDKDATFMKIMEGKAGKWGMLKIRIKMALGMKV